jgi:hypothetical protein
MLGIEGWSHIWGREIMNGGKGHRLGIMNFELRSGSHWLSWFAEESFLKQKAGMGGRPFLVVQ